MEFHEYKRPGVTVDGFILVDGKLLLIKRGREPFKGTFALPGGFVDYGESCEDAIAREIAEECGLTVKIRDIVGVYSDPDRNPKCHVITVCYNLEHVCGVPRAGDDAQEVKLFKIHDIPPLAFDHDRIVRDGLKKVGIILKDALAPEKMD